MDAGAEDLKQEGDTFEITVEPKSFEVVKNALKDNNIKVESDELTMIPASYIKVDESQANQILNLIDALDDNDDVAHVYSNFDIPEEILEKHI